jgi:hypothetical protein
MNKVIKGLLVVVGITLSGMAMADDVPNVPKNQAFCGGVLRAVAIRVGESRPMTPRGMQYDGFAKDRFDRARSRGLDEKSVKYYFDDGFKKMRQLQTSNQANDGDVAFDLMQICLRLQ